jgi:hypothetical protein
MEQKGGKPEHMVAMKMAYEDHLDPGWVDTQAAHMGEQRRSPIKQYPSINDHRAVVAFDRERGPGAEEIEPQATVTSGVRYTS